jgi:hypothetical protein
MADEERAPPEPSLHERRLQLVWNTVVFQLKIAADGMLDLIMSPMSIFAAIAGLIRGGDEPDRYLRQVQEFGYRAERWINLFGHHTPGDNADELLAPLEARLKDEYARGGWVSRSADQMNTMLDSLNRPVKPAESTEPPPVSGVDDEHTPR